VTAIADAPVLTLAHLQQGFARYWPIECAFPPTASWMASFFSRPQALTVVNAVMRQMPDLFRTTRRTSAWPSVTGWVFGGYDDQPVGAAAAFWGRLLYQARTLRSPGIRGSGGWWSRENPAMAAPNGVVADPVNTVLWWRPKLARFYPKRWLHDVLADAALTDQEVPWTWDAQLEDSTTLRLRVWAPTGSQDRVAQLRETLDIPKCCTVVADLSWLDELQQPQQRVSAYDYAKLDALLQGPVQGIFSELQLHEISIRLKRELHQKIQVKQAPTAVVAFRERAITSNTPASSAGRLNGRPHQCRWTPHDDMPTYYVSRHGKEFYTTTGHFEPKSVVVRGGRDRDYPTTIEEIHDLLKDTDKVWDTGLHICFLRGETWYHADRPDPSVDDFLTVRASGTKEAPIIISSYYNPMLNASYDPPHLFGNGSFDPSQLNPFKEATGTGILIKGSRWVQVSELEISNYRNGLQIISYFGERPSISDRTMYWGPKDINLLSLIVRENWNNGIMVSSGVRTLPYSSLVIGDGTLYNIGYGGVLNPPYARRT